eukprot:11136512-Heterocapsa_arctica.AAC.1
MVGMQSAQSTLGFWLPQTHANQTHRAQPTIMFLECWSSYDRLDHLTRLGTHDGRRPLSWVQRHS